MLICQQTHKSHQNYHLITVTLLFIHKTIGCVHQTRSKREQGIQLPVLHTLSDHHICHSVRPLGCYARMEVFLHQAINCMSIDSIIEVFYHFNKMLIATKHIVDNNFVFQ